VRFYLDNDVDTGCRKTLIAAGHDCWTAEQAARSDADDDDQAVYADDRGAVVVTHDKEFTDRRKRNTIGQHVRLCCEQPDGPEVLRGWLPEILPILANRPDVVIEVQSSGLKVTIRWE